MKKLSKIIALLLCLSMVAGFAACGGTEDPTQPATDAISDGNADDALTDGNAADDDDNADAAFDFSEVGQYTADNTEYFIGATGPLTGDTSSYGISVQQGAQLAVDEINAAGGLNGVLFKFDMKDDKSTAADASTGYDALYEAGMQISIGSVTSGSCESFASRADEDGVFFITPSASAASVIAASDYAFRVCFGDPDQGILAAEELSANFENIGAIYDNSDPYSTGIYDAFKAKMAELNVSYIEQSFDAENNRDFST
ncbi:MAG: ABC transporter substrate-binding protein [Clostridia bacterium]|nr:ABC transporter substrate-binding protein [Clostridia bacterium]